MSIHPDVLEKFEELAFVMWAFTGNRRLVVSRNKREGWFGGRAQARLLKACGESVVPRCFRVPEQRLSLRHWYREE